MCGDVKHLLDLYVSGDLDEDRIAQVEEHLAACDSCSREADEYRARLDDLASLCSARQPNALPPFFWQGIQKEILLGTESERAPRRRWRSGTVLALAAAIAIAITAFVFVIARGGPETAGPAGEPPNVAVEAPGLPPVILPPGSRLLPDGTVVPAGKPEEERTLEF